MARRCDGPASQVRWASRSTRDRRSAPSLVAEDACHPSRRSLSSWGARVYAEPTKQNEWDWLPGAAKVGVAASALAQGIGTEPRRLPRRPPPNSTRSSVKIFAGQGPATPGGPARAPRQETGCNLNASKESPQTEPTSMNMRFGRAQAVDKSAQPRVHLPEGGGNEYNYNQCER